MICFPLGLCLDLTGGAHVSGNEVQTFKCSDGNTNQVWTNQLPFLMTKSLWYARDDPLSSGA